MGVRREKWVRVRWLARRKWLACVIGLLATAGAAFADTGYEVRFRDVPEWRLRDTLRQHSETYALRAHAPPSDTLLLRRAELDVPALRDVLRAAGYMGAEPAVALGTSSPRRVVFHLNPGPRYRLGSVRLHADALPVPDARRLGWEPGMPARSDALLAAEQEWLAHTRAQGHLSPRFMRRVYRPDHERRLLDVDLELDPGPTAVWGDISITGLARVEESFVRNELSLPPGAPYTPAQLDETRARLIQLGLFSSVGLAVAETPDDAGRLPVELVLRERRPRTVSAGVRYTTDEGAGARAEWEHRNLGGRAQRVRFTADAGESANALEARVTLPQFGGPRQRLLLSTRAAEESPEAYVSRSLRAAAQLEREWQQRLWGRAGVAFRLSDVDQFDTENNYAFLSFPLEADWNTSRSRLDPRRGFRLLTRAEPFYDLEQQDRGFVKSAVTLNRYQRLNRDRTWMLAGRVTAGAISGAGVGSVPADERFYAGGGNSVRGYAFQTVGPLQDGEPVGGRSLLETSAELRGQVSESFGVVGFVDGGTAYEACAPDFDERFRWGAGVGVRYFTAVGPLRADIAFPLDRRSDVDKHYQFYLSLGQSF